MTRDFFWAIKEEGEYREIPLRIETIRVTEQTVLVAGWVSPPREMADGALYLLLRMSGGQVYYVVPEEQEEKDDGISFSVTMDAACLPGTYVQIGVAFRRCGDTTKGDNKAATDGVKNDATAAADAETGNAETPAELHCMSPAAITFGDDRKCTVAELPAFSKELPGGEILLETDVCRLRGHHLFLRGYLIDRGIEFPARMLYYLRLFAGEQTQIFSVVREDRYDIYLRHPALFGTAGCGFRFDYDLPGDWDTEALTAEMLIEDTITHEWKRAELPLTEKG